jgi:hypothetical protein
MAIGYGKMDDDGTIHLYLKAWDPKGVHGCAKLTYKRSDAIYGRLVVHLGGIKPGKTAPYEPWPDDDLVA